MISSLRRLRAGERYVQVSSALDKLALIRVSANRLLRGRDYANSVEASDDEGLSWNALATASNGVHDFMLLPSGRILSCSYLSGQGIKYSDNNGSTWTAASSATPSFHYFARSPISGRIVTSGVNTGHYYSDDNGATWTTVPDSSKYWYYVLWVGDRFLSISGPSSPVVFSSTDGASWALAYSLSAIIGGTGVWPGMPAYSEKTGRVFLAYENSSGNILVSDDKGVTWEIRNVGVNYSYSYGFLFLESGRLVLQSSPFVSPQFSLFSDDNGETWQRSASTAAMYTFRDREFGIIGSGSGFWKSSDQARSNMFPGGAWVPKSVQQMAWRSVVEHPRTGTLVAASSLSSVYTSVDGGESWTEFPAGGVSDSVDFDGTRNRFVIAGSSFYRHSSDGVAWTAGTNPAATTQAIIAEGSSGALIAVGDSTAQYSTDGGATWSSSVSYGGPATVRVGAHIHSTGRTVVVGASGTNRVAYTDNNGVSWTAVSVPALAWRGICFVPTAKRLVAVSFTASTTGVITSDDYGVTWVSRYLPSAVQLIDVKYIPGFEIIIAVGTSGARSFISYDLGTTWHTCNLSTTESWFALCWSQNRKRLLAFAQSGTRRSQISQGFTWEWPVKLVQQRTVTTSNLYDVIVLDSGRYVAAVYDTGTGKFMYSDDRGKSWVLCSVAGSGEGTAVLDCGSGIVIGLTTTAILRSTDYGSTWSEVSASVFAQVGRLCRKAANGYLFAGCSLPAGDAKIMRSIDNGVTWSAVFAGAANSGNVRAIAADENTGNIVAAVENGTLNIMYSTNNGDTWTQIPHAKNGAQKNRWLRAFYDAPRKRILLGGISLISGSNLLLSSSDGGVTWSSIPHKGSTAQGFCVGPSGSLFIAGFTTVGYTKTGNTSYPNLVEVAQEDVASIVGIAYDPAINRIITCSSGVGTANNIQTADVWSDISTPKEAPVRYCACGASGYVAVSDDAVTWRQISTGTTNVMYAVVRGPDRFVVFGSYRCIHILDSGAVNIYTTAEQYPFSAYYDGTYYWLANNSTTQIMRSTNAISWTGVALPGTSATVIAVGGIGSQILVGRNTGYYSFSTNGGTSWTTFQTGTNAKWSVDINNSVYVISGFDSVITSPTALSGSWTVGANSIFSGAVTAGLRFAKNGNVLIHTGAGSVGKNSYKRSVDGGLNFDATRNVSFPCTLNRGCVFDGTRFLLTGSTGDIVSLDGNGLNGVLLTNVGVEVIAIAASQRPLY